MLTFNSFSEQIKINQSLRAEVQMLTISKKELETLNSVLRDEHTATHLLQTSLEEKLREALNEANQLRVEVLKLKAQDADKMNEENDMFLR